MKTSATFKYFLLAYYGITSTFVSAQLLSQSCRESTQELFTNSALGAASGTLEAILENSIANACGSDLTCTIDFATLGENAAEYASSCTDAGGTVFLYDLSSTCSASAFGFSESGTLNFKNVHVCVPMGSCTGLDVARSAEREADLVLNLVEIFIQAQTGGAVDVECDSTIVVSDEAGNVVASGRLGQSSLAPTPAPTPVPVGVTNGDGATKGIDSAASIPFSVATLSALGMAVASILI